MGTLLYGNPSILINFDDRALAHLQIVITAKLRRGESFAFTWTNASSEGSGRNIIWLHPTTTLLYRFFGGTAPDLNRTWIEALMLSANSPNGLVFTPEPKAVPRQPLDPQLP